MSDVHIEFGDFDHKVVGPARQILDMIALLTGDSHEVILGKSLGLYASKLYAAKPDS